MLMRERAQASGIELEVTILTAEEQPLDLFGDEAGAGVADALSQAGVRTMLGLHVELPRPSELVVQPGDRHLHFDRVVAVPRLVGSTIAGLPSDSDGFLPIGPDCRVSGVEGVFASGDCTDFPVKHGSIAAHQADAVAVLLAALAGLALEPTQFQTSIHGMPLTSRAGRYVYFSAELAGGVARDSRLSDAPTWSPAAKVAARHLGPCLNELW